MTANILYSHKLKMLGVRRSPLAIIATFLWLVTPSTVSIDHTCAQDINASHYILSELKSCSFAVLRVLHLNRDL